MVLFKRRVSDQGVGPAGQRQLGAGAGERFLGLIRIIKQDQEPASTYLKGILNKFQSVIQHIYAISSNLVCLLKQYWSLNGDKCTNYG